MGVFGEPRANIPRCRRVSNAANKSMSVLARKGLLRCHTPKPRQQGTLMPIILQIYDLLPPSANRRYSKVGLGAYHTGLEVMGCEYSYGEADPTVMRKALEDDEQAVVTGIFTSSPGCGTTDHRESVVLGWLPLTPEQIDWVVTGLEREWLASDYHFLRHNCNHFTQAMATRLAMVSLSEPLQVPKWVNRAADTARACLPGAFTTWVLERMKRKHQQAIVPPKSNTKPTASLPPPRLSYDAPALRQDEASDRSGSSESLVVTDPPSLTNLNTSLERTVNVIRGLASPSRVGTTEVKPTTDDSDSAAGDAVKPPCVSEEIDTGLRQNGMLVLTPPELRSPPNLPLPGLGNPLRHEGHIIASVTNLHLSLPTQAERSDDPVDDPVPEDFSESTSKDDDDIVQFDRGDSFVKGPWPPLLNPPDPISVR